MNRLQRWTVLLIALALTAPPLAAQGTASVSGRVMDSVTSQPIPGVRVAVVGSPRGVLTDRDGRYELSGLSAGTITLRAQRIGFAAADRVVALADGSSASVDFVLIAAATTLSDVVVTGYGTDSRANLSSSVSSVGAAELENTPAAGVDAAIQGRAAGVQVIQNAGNPGVGMSVRIRGSASISASNQPLYVIDGVPLLRDNFSQLDVGGQDVSGVTGLNPDEIESIDVLKDAAAAAIYGSRGSNGVIMVTTKRGSANRTRITYSTYAGTQSVPKSDRWQMMNGTEYMEYMNEAAENDGYGALYFGDPATAGPGTDWQSEVLRSAPVTNLNVGMSGGSDRVQYFISGSQFNQKGVALGSGYNRRGARVNVDLNASDKLRFQTSLSINREDNDRIENDNTIAGVVANAIANQPIFAARDSLTGLFTTTDECLSSLTMCMAYENPIAIGTYNFAESRSLRAFGSLEAAYVVSDMVTVNGRLGMDVLNLRDLRWFSPRVGGSYAESVFGESIIGNQTANRYVLETYVDFRRAPSQSLSFSATGGASVERNGAELDYLDGIGFGRDQFQYPGNAATVTVYDGNWAGNNLVSFFSRANAAWKSRYLFSGSLRVDGSSRFGKNNRFGVFPAASLGWKITDEPFMAGLRRRADIKLRASYGVTGNQDIFDDFAPRPRFAKANFADIPGIAQSSFGNPNLRWESTREYDAGFDLLLFSGRLMLIGDWYKKITNDLLLNRPITSTSGQTSVFENVGNMENNGFELTINSQNLRSASDDGLRWNTGFNISWNSNKVTKLFQNEPFNTGIRSVNRVEVGQPLGAFYTIRFLGVDPATGDAMFDDINNDGVIDAADRVIVGNPQPKYWGGFTNELTWKGFDLRTFLQFTQGHTIFNGIALFALDGGYNWDNKFRRALDRWQQPGDVTDEPRASYDGLSGAVETSSRYFEDGSYVRLQEITLGYKMPAKLAGAMRMTDSRIFVSGRNLQTWTKFSGYSPDVNSNGSSANTSLATEFYSYPLARTFMIGISGSF